jgi:hypothetical protein
MGRSHHDYLAMVRRIGKRLLVASHSGLKDSLTKGLTEGAPRASFKDSSIIED